jgi:hypothetical protein
VVLLLLLTCFFSAFEGIRILTCLYYLFAFGSPRTLGDVCSGYGLRTITRRLPLSSGTSVIRSDTPVILEEPTCDSPEYSRSLGDLGSARLEAPPPIFLLWSRHRNHWSSARRTATVLHPRFGGIRTSATWHREAVTGISSPSSAKWSDCSDYSIRTLLACTILIHCHLIPTTWDSSSIAIQPCTTSSKYQHHSQVRRGTDGPSIRHHIGASTKVHAPSLPSIIYRNTPGPPATRCHNTDSPLLKFSLQLLHFRSYGSEQRKA